MSQEMHGDLEDDFAVDSNTPSPVLRRQMKRLKKVREVGRYKVELSPFYKADEIADPLSDSHRSIIDTTDPKPDEHLDQAFNSLQDSFTGSDLDEAQGGTGKEVDEKERDDIEVEAEENLRGGVENASSKPESNVTANDPQYGTEFESIGEEPDHLSPCSGDHRTQSTGTDLEGDFCKRPAPSVPESIQEEKLPEENVGNWATETSEMEQSSQTGRKKRKEPVDRSKTSKSEDPYKSKGSKRPKKSEIEEIHSQSQRLLRETPNASFKHLPVVQKPISSVLEKIRLRKQQLEEKDKDFCVQRPEVPSKEAASLKEEFSEEHDGRTVLSNDEDTHESIRKMDEPENGGLGNPSAQDACAPNPVDNDDCQRIAEDKGIQSDCEFRAPVLDSEDKEAIPQESKEDETALLTSNPTDLKPDSHYDEEYPYEDDKENVEPSPKRTTEATSYNKVAPVKAFFEDEAEDEDEDVLVRHSEDDESEEDENEDLADLIATTQDVENEVDKRRRDELHRKWLEQQDTAETDDLLLRLKNHGKQGYVHSRRPALLEEVDNDILDNIEGSEENDVQSTDKLSSSTSLSQDSRHAEDEFNFVKNSLKADIDDESDKTASSDDEGLEEDLRIQRILQESEEQEALISPVDDERSREILGLIKKENVAPATKKKPKSTSTFHEIIGLGGNSNSSSKTSFLGRTTSSSLQVSHKQVVGGPRSYIFGRDDSNSKHSFSSSRNEEDLMQETNENGPSVKDSNNQSLSQSKSKKNVPGKKASEKEAISSQGLSLFEILQRKNTGEKFETKKVVDITHFAIKSSSSVQRHRK